MYKQHCLLPLSLNNLHTTTYHHHTIISCKERPLTFRPDRLCAITCPRKQAHRWFMLVSAPRYSSGYLRGYPKALAQHPLHARTDKQHGLLFKGPNSRYFQPLFFFFFFFFIRLFLIAMASNHVFFLHPAVAMTSHRPPFPCGDGRIHQTVSPLTAPAKRRPGASIASLSEATAASLSIYSNAGVRRLLTTLQ